MSEKIISESAEKDWGSIMEADERFCEDVLNSNESPVEKMKKLSNNPHSCEDIVAALLKYGPYLENYVEGTELLGTGESIGEFLSTNCHRLDALEILCNEVKKADPNQISQNRFINDVFTAVTLYGIYTKMDELYQPTDSEDEEGVRRLYTEAMTVVEICAVYFQKHRVMSESDITYYRFGQSAYFKSQYDVLKAKKEEAAKESEKAPVAPEKTAESVQQVSFVAVKQKNPNRPIYIACAICAGVFALGLILALLEKQIGNYLLLISGLAEVAVGFILFKIARQRERFTCPECGAKRIHHRKFLETTEKVTTMNWKNPAYPDGKHKIEYTHKYLDTYTCPNCGKEQRENVSKSGGSYTTFNNGRIQDQSTDPREF